MTLELFCFCTDPTGVRAVAGEGVDALVVDWEQGDKRVRQTGHDTLISSDTPEDLDAVRAATTAPIICRINGVGPWTAAEVERAITGGADELLIPMVRGTDEIDHVAALVRGRARVGALLETEEAVEAAADISGRGLSRVYVGLNDLRIARGRPTIFEPFIDGTLDRLRVDVGDVPFGVGGLTIPGAGTPVPVELLLGELLRLRCDFTFLRRSFWQAAGADPARAVRDIRSSIAAAATRTSDQIDRDREALERVVDSLRVRA